MILFTNMKFYIGYKFTNIKDQELLKAGLEALCSSLKANGHEVFILGRDVQNWLGSSMPLTKTFPAIVSHLFKSDVFLGFITDETTNSHGLRFENFLASVLSKKKAVLALNTVPQANYIVTAKTVETFNDFAEISQKVPVLLDKLKILNS